MKFINDHTGATFSNVTRTEHDCVCYTVFKEKDGVTSVVTLGTMPAGQYSQAYRHGVKIARSLSANDSYLN